MNSYLIEAGTGQHIGNRPEQNERAALYAGSRARGFMLAVLADGVSGGALGAEQALHTARQHFDTFAADGAVSVERLAELLRAIALEAHTVMLMNPIGASREPQSTLTLLVLTPHGQAVWACVGDSRLYRFSGSACAERSNDAAYVAHLVEQKKLPLEAARKHRNSKLLANVLGNPNQEPFVAIGSYAGLQAGDAFMLCSDGLWQFFTDAELAAVVERNGPRQAAERLIDKATERAQGKGGNCTMAIVKLVKPPAEARNYTVRKMGRAV